MLNQAQHDPLDTSVQLWREVMADVEDSVGHSGLVAPRGIRRIGNTPGDDRHRGLPPAAGKPRLPLPMSVFFIFSMPVWVRIGLALATAFLADRRGRSGVGWFILGLLLAPISLVLVLVLQDQTEAKAQRIQDEENLGRMRERVKKERQVSDGRYRDLERRLDHHDRALGLNTKDTPAPELAEQAPEAPGLDGVHWFFVEDGEAAGPVPFASLQAMWREGALYPSSLVWTEGMNDWRRVGELESLREELSS